MALTDSKVALHILERPPVTFPLLSSTPATALNPTANPYSIPSVDEFERSWAIWDLITSGMIPPELLHSKPIDLRHKPLFYIGHLPTFANILLSRELKAKPVGPRSYLTIFERGIDPNVDDPDQCHSHSEVPERDEDWPVIEDVLQYRDEVRGKVIKRLISEMESGERPLTRRAARTLMMVHEHDGFHIEVSCSLATAPDHAADARPPRRSCTCSSSARARACSRRRASRRRRGRPSSRSGTRSRRRRPRRCSSGRARSRSGTTTRSRTTSRRRSRAT